MKTENAAWLLKNSVMKGDDPTKATVDLFLEKYNTLVGKRYVTMMKRVVAGIISAATFFLYFILVAVSHCDAGPGKTSDPFENNIFGALSPTAHPWICTFLVTVAAIVGLIVYAQHLYENKDKWL